MRVLKAKLCLDWIQCNIFLFLTPILLNLDTTCSMTVRESINRYFRIFRVYNIGFQTFLWSMIALMYLFDWIEPWWTGWNIVLFAGLILGLASGFYYKNKLKCPHCDEDLERFGKENNPEWRLPDDMENCPACKLNFDSDLSLAKSSDGTSTASPSREQILKERQTKVSKAAQNFKYTMWGSITAMFMSLPVSLLIIRYFAESSQVLFFGRLLGIESVGLILLGSIFFLKSKKRVLVLYPFIIISMALLDISLLFPAITRVVHHGFGSLTRNQIFAALAGLMVMPVIRIVSKRYAAKIVIDAEHQGKDHKDLTGL